MKQGVLILVFVFATGAGAAAQNDPALLLFGGADHRTFLGCLNCGQYEGESICNKYAEHGSKYA